MHWLLFALLIGDQNKRINQLEQGGVVTAPHDPKTCVQCRNKRTGWAMFFFFAPMVVVGLLAADSGWFWGAFFGTGVVEFLVVWGVILALAWLGQKANPSTRRHQQSGEQERPVPQGWLN